MQINTHNFIRFYDAAADSSTIPTPYILEQNRCAYMPLLVPGETVSFFVNIKGGFNYGDFAAIKIELLSLAGAKIVLSGLSKIDTIGELYNVYLSFQAPQNLDEGMYTFSLSTPSGVYVSNLFRCVKSDYDNTSVIVEYRNLREIYGFNYDELPDFYNRFRLAIYNVGESFEYQHEQYRSASSGKLRDFNGSVDKYLKLESYFFDKEAHHACAAMLFHSDTRINGKRYTLKTGYQYNPLVQSLTSKGTFELWDEEYSRLNKC